MSDVWFGWCDVCRQAPTFGSKEERDLWEQHHESTPTEPDDDDGDEEFTVLAW